MRTLLFLSICVLAIVARCETQPMQPIVEPEEDVPLPPVRDDGEVVVSNESSESRLTSQKLGNLKQHTAPPKCKEKLEEVLVTAERLVEVGGRTEDIVLPKICWPALKYMVDTAVGMSEGAHCLLVSAVYGGQDCSFDVAATNTARSAAGTAVQKIGAAGAVYKICDEAGADDNNEGVASAADNTTDTGGSSVVRNWVQGQKDHLDSRAKTVDKVEDRKEHDASKDQFGFAKNFMEQLKHAKEVELIETEVVPYRQKVWKISPQPLHDFIDKEVASGEGLDTILNKVQSKLKEGEDVKSSRCEGSSEKGVKAAGSDKPFLEVCENRPAVQH